MLSDDRVDVALPSVWPKHIPPELTSASSSTSSAAPPLTSLEIVTIMTDMSSIPRNICPSSSVGFFPIKSLGCRHYVRFPRFQGTQSSSLMTSWHTARNRCMREGGCGGYNHCLGFTAQLLLTTAFRIALSIPGMTFLQSTNPSRTMCQWGP